MVGGGRKWLLVAVTVASFGLLLAVTLSSAERIFLDGDNASSYSERSLEKVWNFLWRSNESEYHHVWPAMKFGWRIVIGTIVGFFGAAVGSVGGVGGGGIFVSMLTLIIGFDAETSSADSKQGSSHTTSSERGNWIMRILELRLFWKDRRKSYSMASMEPCDLQKKRSRNRDLLAEIWNHPPGSIPFSFHSHSIHSIRIPFAL